jgi:ATP-dependent DNA helicase RecQ
MKLFRGLLATFQLRRAARDHFGWSSLRPGQIAAMRAIMRGHDAMVVLPTGAGKSAVYQIPAALLPGPTIVISPLLALQHDQVAALNNRGVRELTAVQVSSAQTPKQQAAAFAALAAGNAKLLFITPEQLASPERLEQVKALRPALIAVDEAHCISTWGQDFRPEYLSLGHVVRAVGRPPAVALTATASPPVREDISERLGLRKPKVVIGGLDRHNLFLQAVHCPTEDHRWRRLLAFLASVDGAGIVYVPTRRIAEELTEKLVAAGHDASYYHGGMPAGERKRKHAQFAADEIPVMVATSAFGMGIDKPNIRWVAHVALPDSPDSYLQEIGRAGRDGEPAQVVLLYRAEDVALQRFFTGGMPPEDELLLVAVGVHSGIKSKSELAKQTKLPPRKVAGHLTLLESVGGVAIGNRGELRKPPYGPAPETAARLAVAEAERHQTLQRSRTDMMRTFAESSSCRVQPLLAYFGEQMPGGCGHCDNCVSGTATTPAREAVPPIAERRPVSVTRGRSAVATPGDRPYPLHCTVRHRQWGAGTVLGYERDRMTVLFEEVGYKTLSVAVVQDNDLLAIEPAGL